MTTHHNILEAVVTKATAMLSRRQTYAAAVLAGEQRWSGADLKGKAKKFSSSYAHGRRSAYSALRKAGGEVIAVDHNRSVGACDRSSEM